MIPPNRGSLRAVFFWAASLIRLQIRSPLESDRQFRGFAFVVDIFHGRA